MPVVNNRAPSLPDLTAAKPSSTPVFNIHGRVRLARHQVDIANGDSASSTYEIARIQSHARLLRISTLHTPGIGGLTDVDLGFADDPDALIDGANLTSAGTQAVMSAVPIGDEQHPLYALAGMTKDPKRDLSLFVTLNAAATAAGSLLLEAFYVVD